MRNHNLKIKIPLELNHSNKFEEDGNKAGYENQNVLRGFDPLLLFFMNEIKIVSYSFSSSVIEYNSNEKLLKA